MSYSNNPLLPKARADALRLVFEQGMSISIASRRSGINRSTLWRWKRKWLEINENVQLENFNRPGRTSNSKFRQAALTRQIGNKQTESTSAPSKPCEITCSTLGTTT